MQEFSGRVAAITGAGSGFGRAFAGEAAARGMRLLLADIDAAALEETATALRAEGCEVRAEAFDVGDGAAMERFATEGRQHFGAVHLLFNNAGVGLGGLMWEHSARDWAWVLGVNLWGVIHGVRCFVPAMLASGEACHIVNTASAAGLIAPPTMGVYNVSKHAVVSLTETLHHDLRLIGARIGVSLLCPAFVNTGIAEAARHRPEALRDAAPPTASQVEAARAMRQATAAGRLSAADIAAQTFAAIAADRFYILPHPRILPAVAQRLEDVLEQRTPRDPFSHKPEVAFKATGGAVQT